MTITKTEINALKALCISMIVVHNVCHNLIPSSGNEFAFYSEYIKFFCDNFFTGHIEFWRPIALIMVFYGWLGVPFFAFATAYGLSAKYGEGKLDTWQYIKRNALKFLLLLIPLYIMQIILLISSGKIDIPGLYWYVNMSFQLYLWFIILRKVPTKYLLMIIPIVYLLLVFVPTNYVYYIRRNSIGWLIEFILGIVIARNKDFEIQLRYAIPLAIIAFAGTIFCSYSVYTYMFAGPCFICLLVMSRKIFSKSKILCYLGTISASIYVLHGVIRPLIYAAQDSDAITCISAATPPLAVGIIVLIATILCSIPYNIFYSKICKKWIDVKYESKYDSSQKTNLPSSV